MEKKPLKYKKGEVKLDRNGFTFIDIYNMSAKDKLEYVDKERKPKQFKIEKIKFEDLDALKKRKEQKNNK